MTNKERLKAYLGFAPADDNTTEAALLDFAIDPSETYTVTNLIPVKRAAISVMRILLTTANTTNMDHSQTWDKTAVAKRVDDLEEEIEPKGPTIRAVHKW